jgi:hypothetical protein
MKKIKITENQAKLLGIVSKTPNKKSAVIKITLEQYNRLIKEGGVKIKGGLNRVDNSFKREFKGSGVKTFSEDENEISLGKFNIEAPIDIPNSKMKKVRPIPIKENSIENDEVEDKHPAEVADLLKYLYRKSDTLSPYWEQNGLSHDSITNTLLSKGMLVKKNGTHQLSKSLGDAKTAVKTVEEELRKHVKPVVDENDNYPAGAKDDSRAPYNQKDDEYVEARDPMNPLFTGLYANREIIILDSKGSKFVFYHGNVNDEDYMNAEAISYPVDDKMDNIRPTKEDIANYVNLMVEDGQINVVSGPTNGETPYDFYETGNEYVVIIDDEVKEHLISHYDKDKNLVSILSESNVQEEEGDDLKSRLAKIRADSQKWEKEFFDKRDAENAINSKKALTKMRMTAKGERTPAPDVEKKDPPAPDFFGTPYDEVMEMNTGMPGATGMFVGPFGAGKPDMVSRDINKPKVKVVKEMTAGPDSVGPYDANALNIAADGTFKKGEKTKAQKEPQIKKGSFVKLNSCVKLNNNKSAQNGKCNQGDSGVVSYSKTAPSSLYEVIAKKTGKTIEEVKRIIESKNTKA